MGIEDGSTYAPTGRPAPVVQPGEFRFALAFLDHGHIYGMKNGLREAGGTLTAVFDPDPQKVSAFCEQNPGVAVATEFAQLLDDKTLHLIASAAVPDKRAAIGQQVMLAGKDFFTDKSPFTTLEQLARTREVIAATGRRYHVYYAERIHNEAAWQAGELIAAGAVGRVLQVLNLAPHRLSADKRPAWFFEKSRYGGIITDIGSHQVEQFFTYAGCHDAEVNFARVANCSHPETPGLEDFGELSLRGDNGASFYSRLDWYTPDGLPTWGDGRTFILGTQGTLEVRKFLDLGRRAPASLIFLTDGDRVQEINCLDQVGYPFFGQLILDVLNGTEHAMSQAHALQVAQVSMLAQQIADSAPGNFQ